jgi:hypothetical protein
VRSFDPSWITPAAPRAGEIVSVNIRGEICDGIFERPGYPQITRQGNSIRLLEYGHHWDSPDLCIYDIGTLVQPIDAFPSGDYTLTVDFIYPDVLGPTTATLGTIPFTIVGVTSVAPIPALTTTGRSALLMLVSVAALTHMRSRRPTTIRRLV